MLTEIYNLVIWDLLQPFPILCLVLTLALIRLWRKRLELRRRLLWLIVPFLGLVILCLPAVAWLALGSLEWQYPPLQRRPADAAAIVVLASYVSPPNSVWPKPVLDDDSLKRCLLAVEVYRQGEAMPIVVSGGKPYASFPGPDCASAMRDFLLQLGVKDSDILVERLSTTTYENAVECRKLLAERKMDKIILVTNASHLVRAVGCFRQQGITVVPCGCQYRATDFDRWPTKFIPSPVAGATCQRVGHEWLGVAWYWLRGRL